MRQGQDARRMIMIMIMIVILILIGRGTCSFHVSKGQPGWKGGSWTASLLEEIDAANAY